MTKKIVLFDKDVTVEEAIYQLLHENVLLRDRIGKLEKWVKSIPYFGKRLQSSSGKG